MVIMVLFLLGAMISTGTVMGAQEMTAQTYALSQRERLWTSGQRDENSIHAVGNGQMVALSTGPNVECLFGPPYSSPNILQIETRCEKAISAVSRRELCAAIWRHVYREGSNELAQFIEFAPSGMPAYVRRFQCREPGIQWVLRPHSEAKWIPARGLSGVWRQQLPPGTKIFRDPYITDRWSFHWVITSGDCTGVLQDDGTLVVSLQPGKGDVIVVGANDYAQGVQVTETLMKLNSAVLLDETRAWWSAFTQRRLAARPQLKRISGFDAECLDGIAVMMKAQQASEGPTIIGWHSPMAYIRDLYGAARGMLALGMYEEARQMLEFRFRKFERFGDLRTAELIGTDAARHTYNDEVEGPAYLLLQVRDYLKATGDTASVRRWQPMMEWCWQVQQRQLVNGLLPFNGDETYIAGRLFPFEGLQQGSADTTLAFLVSGEWLTAYAEGEGMWTAEKTAACRRLLADVKRAWREAFVAEDRIWCNAPEREQAVTPPRFRRFGNMWLERDASGHYLPHNVDLSDLPPAVSPGRMTLNSVSLLPDFLGGGPLTYEERCRIVERIAAHTRPNGTIPTALPGDVPDHVLDAKAPGWDGGHVRVGDRTVGYDPGLLLIAQLAVGHSGAAATYQRLMRMLDQAGAWNEYYDSEDRAERACIRANMWASGINAEAVVRYLLRN